MYEWFNIIGLVLGSTAAFIQLYTLAMKWYRRRAKMIDQKATAKNFARTYFAKHEKVRLASFDPEAIDVEGTAEYSLVEYLSKVPEATQKSALNSSIWIVPFYLSLSLLWIALSIGSAYFALSVREHHVVSIMSLILALFLFSLGSEFAVSLWQTVRFRLALRKMGASYQRVIVLNYHETEARRDTIKNFVWWKEMHWSSNIGRISGFLLGAALVVDYFLEYGATMPSNSYEWGVLVGSYVPVIVAIAVVVFIVDFVIFLSRTRKKRSLPKIAGKNAESNPANGADDA